MLQAATSAVGRAPAVAERPPEQLNQIHPALQDRLVAAAKKSSLALVFAQPVAYDLAVDLQQGLIELCRSQELKPILLLLSHPLVVTLGRGAPADKATGASAPVVRSHRGGSVTVHGPGQLVGYPILDLRRLGLSVHGYIRALENMLESIAAAFGVRAYSRPGLTGLWTERGKIASIGIAVRHGVTWHGFALYLQDQRTNFGALNPCALPGVAPDAIAHYGAAAWTFAVRACLHDFARLFAGGAVERMDFANLTAADGDLAAV